MKSKVVVYGPLYEKWYAILVNDGVAAKSNQSGSYEAAMGFALRRYPELGQERQPYARGREESENGSDSREAAPIWTGTPGAALTPPMPTPALMADAARAPGDPLEHATFA